MILIFCFKREKKNELSKLLIFIKIIIFLSLK